MCDLRPWFSIIPEFTVLGCAGGSWGWWGTARRLRPKLSWADRAHSYIARRPARGRPGGRGGRARRRSWAAPVVALHLV